MKTFIKKTKSHIIFVGIILLVLYLFLKENYDGRYIYQVSDKKIENAIVVVGDSKSLSAFYDSVIIENVNIPFYNFSTWGANPLNNYEEIQLYQIKDCDIYLVVSSRIFASNDTIGFTSKKQFNFFQNLNIKSLADEIKSNILHKDEGKWEYEGQKSGSIIFKNPVRTYSPYNREGDSTLYTTLMNSTENRFFKDRKIRHFVNLYKFLSKNNRVTIIDLPDRFFFEEISESYEADLFRRIEMETGSKIIDFGSLPDSLFYDSHHLNKTGSIVFTEKFVKYFISQDKNHEK